MKRILITAENSYIGNSFYECITKNYPNEYDINKVSLRKNKITDIDLEEYDVVFHVAGIVHSDNGKISKKKEALYYKVNTDFTIELAEKSNQSGVKQFIYMSSIIVYGKSGRVGNKKIINKNTIPNPENAYGDSKLKAENGILVLNNDSFKVAVIRSPMVYGKNCKGNYRLLEKLSYLLPIFPYVDNERSAVNIDRLCEYIKNIIDEKKEGIFFPQDEKYMNTSLMIKSIAEKNNKKIILIKGFNWLFKFFGVFSNTINKAFGNLVYDFELK